MTARPIIGVVLLVTACGTAEVPSSGPIASSDRAQDFALEISAGESVVAVDEAIPVQTTLTYDGGGTATAWGSGSGLVGFTVERLEDGLTPGAPIFSADCVPHEFEAGVPVPIAFAKSGAYDEDTPNVDFIRRYLDDPELHLPAGTWRITATASGYLGDSCSDPRLDLETSIEVRVVD